MFVKEVEKIEEAFLASTMDLSNTEEVLKMEIEGETVEDIMTRLTATIGEKIAFRRALSLEGAAGAYTHSNNKVAVLIQGNADAEALRGISMHVAAMQPKFMSLETIDEEYRAEVEKELTEEYREKMADKPEHILENIVKGAIAKKLAEDTLSEQDFVVDPSKKVKDVAGGRLDNMIVFNLGEGIEKVESDFAAEVAAAVNG